MLNMAIAAINTISFFIGVLLHEWIWGKDGLNDGDRATGREKVQRRGGAASNLLN